MGSSVKNASHLPCPLCCQTNFPNIDALRISLIKVTSRPLKCPICDEVLLGLDKLTIHLFGHTLLVDQDVPKPVKKQVKEKRETAPKAVKHKERVEVAAPSVCRCEFCGFTFQDSEILTMHMKLVHKYCDRASDEPENPSDRKFQCHLCSKYFKLKGALRIHLKVAHVGFYSPRRQNRKNLCEALMQQQQQPAPVPVATITQPPVVSAFPIQPLDVPFQGRTQQLQLTYSNDGIQLVHSRSMDQIALPSYQLATASQSPNGFDVPEHQFISPMSSPTAVISETGVKTWECDICAKSFTTKYFLKKHKRLHTGEMPYTCNICGKTFTFQQSYHKHLLYHSDEKPHSCSICSRSFKELSTLHNHERIHSGEKPFACETCGKCFRQRVSYLVHRRIHTGVMPYRCTACDKSFRYKVSQRTHKCTAQPPGLVVRQSGDLLDKLINQSMRPETDLMTQSLDDLLNESCKQMGIEVGDSYPPPQVDENVASPTDRLKNLCLMSPGQDPTPPPNFNGSLDTINEDSFKQLLYGDEHLQ